MSSQIDDFSNPMHIVRLKEVMNEFNIPINIIDEVLYNLTEEVPDRVKKQAKKLGLVWKRVGYGKEGEKGITHKVEDDKLVPVGDDKKSPDKSGGAGETPPEKPKITKIDTNPFSADSEAEAEKKEKEFKNKVNQIESKSLKNILNKNTASYTKVAPYLNDKEKEIYDKLLNDLVDLVQMEDGEEKVAAARRIVDEYKLERNVNGKKVYVKGIAYEARKILGMGNKNNTGGVDIIRDTIENALGEKIPGEVKATDAKQEVMTTSKPDLGKKSIRTASDIPDIKQIFDDKIFEGIGEEFHQLHIATDPNTGEVLLPSSDHSEEYLRQSIEDNVALAKTIDKLKELEKSQNVSPKLRESLENHQKRLQGLVAKPPVDENGDKLDIKIPSEEARDYVEKSYGELVEKMALESPEITKAMMKNMAEMYLYDSEIAGGEECYLPSHGSFPSGDKIKKTQGVNGVEKVQSVSVKFGKTGKYGSYGFPGETGQYQKYHPDEKYRNRNGSRPGDDGFEIGVNNDLIDDDVQFDKLIEESGLAAVISDTEELKSVVKEMLEVTRTLKKNNNYIQNPKGIAAAIRKKYRDNKGNWNPPEKEEEYLNYRKIPSGLNQMKLMKKELLAKNAELSKRLSKIVDYDNLRRTLGEDNANVAMKGPMEMINILTFCGTLRTSGGLPAISHNHQEIKDGKLVSETESGSDNPKLWKFTLRAFDDRGGGLISSFNSARINYDTEEI